LGDVDRGSARVRRKVVQDSGNVRANTQAGSLQVVRLAPEIAVECPVLAGERSHSSTFGRLTGAFSTTG